MMVMLVVLIIIIIIIIIVTYYYYIIIIGAKGDWDFLISNLVKTPDGSDIYSLW